MSTAILLTCQIGVHDLDQLDSVNPNFVYFYESFFVLLQYSKDVFWLFGSTQTIP